MEILNPSYLSRKFKEETKETLTNFIFLYKVRKRTVTHMPPSLEALTVRP